MPDWTYQTLFRQPLRSLPFTAAQATVFRTMGLLGRCGAGRAVIRLLGHAKSPEEAKWQKAGLCFPGRSGLACGVDLAARAVSATSLFGFGMIETGPVYATQSESASLDTRVEWRPPGIVRDRAAAIIDRQPLSEALKRNSFRNRVPVFVRVLVNAKTTTQDCDATADLFRSQADGFSVQFTDARSYQAQEHDVRLQALKSHGQKLLIVLDADCPDESITVTDQVDGWILETHVRESGRGDTSTAAIVESLKTQVQSLRKMHQDQIIAVSGVVEQPMEALSLLDAGADLVMLESGFVEAGPGLPKRINAAVRARQLATAAVSSRSDDRVPVTHQSWFWAFLLGLALFLGGCFAVVIGWTRVLLPYDEEFLGMLRDEVCSLNTQLLPFMSHDRVTLAGTMLSLGPLYMALAWFGDRRGMHWARVAVLASAFLGFLSFFLFLGFGYFDPFHAFISAVLFQMTLLCLRSHQLPKPVVEYDFFNTASWRRAMWGQLLMVIQGTAILAGGVVISSFGVTTVFVAEDLEFMQTSRDTLIAANPRLVPLVAHDRASFGGMLMSTGVTVLLTALWGWQRGRRWLWFTLAATGSVAYGMTMVIHWHVGYTSLVHLLPAYGGFAILWFSLLLSREWMFEDPTFGECVIP